jgi:hypothetical protein
MVELRNALLTAKSAGRVTFTEVTLGTRYPNRILAVNPPPAAGTLRTGEMRPITVTSDGTPSEICPSGGTIQSRTLRYTPNYNAYQGAPDVVYENTVLYLDFGDRKITLTYVTRPRGNQQREYRADSGQRSLTGSRRRVGDTPDEPE